MMTYPDAFFVCGPTTRSTIDTDAITNPTVIVEVTSKTTESYDRTEKLAAYQRIDSLRAVVFVSHREHRVTIVERAEASWLSTEFRGGERAVISSPPAEFAVDELYQVLARL
jgi:Uma2 family endonuclease